MNDPAYIMECARIHDTMPMLNLEKTYFDSCWHSEAKEVAALIKQNPMMFRVCKVDGVLKGYYWVFPLEYSIWQQVISGKMDEKEMVKHIKSFKDKNLYLYISSVIVDQDDKDCKKFTKALVHDFGRNFVLYQNGDLDIRGVGAITISAGGRRLMEKSDFAHKGTFEVNGKPVRTYAINHANLVNQARTMRKQRLKSIA